MDQISFQGIVVPKGTGVSQIMGNKAVREMERTLLSRPIKLLEEKGYDVYVDINKEVTQPHPYGLDWTVIPQYESVVGLVTKGTTEILPNKSVTRDAHIPEGDKTKDFIITSFFDLLGKFL